MYVCLCKAVSEREVKGWIQKGVKTVQDIREKCAAGSGCGACVTQIQEMITKETVSTKEEGGFLKECGTCQRSSPP